MMHQTIETAPSATVTILPERQGEAEAKLAKLARRAAKYGQAITWTVEKTTREVSRERWDGRKVKMLETRLHYTVTGQAPRVGDFTLVAALERVDGGVIISGAEVGKRGRTWDGRCEHCKAPRARVHGYVVEDAKGRRKVVGKSCLRDFLGTDTPAGALWTFQWLREVQDQDEESWGGGGRRWIDTPLGVIAAARACIALWGWKPSSYQSGRTTSGDVGLIYRAASKNEAADQAKLLGEMKRNGDLYQAKAEEVLAWGERMKPRGDYEHNLKVALAGEFVTQKTFALVVSAAAAFDRQKAKAEEAKAEAAKFPKSDWFGVIGTRYRGQAVTMVRSIGLPDNGFGPSVLLVLRMDGGQVLKWKTAYTPEVKGQDGRWKRAEAGERFVADFTVKGHGEFREERETRVNRVVLAEAE